MSTAIDLSRVAQAFVAIRDARTAKRHAWEAEDALLEADADKLKLLMLQIMNTSGIQSVKTEYGTIYRSEKIKPSAADWGAIWEWAKANDGFEIVEKRLKATFIKQFMDENNGALPPGVNVHREYEVAVRRPNGSTDRGAEE